MKKEFNMMLIVVVCAMLGIISAVIVNLLYTNGIIIDELITNTISINDVMFSIFFAWIVMGIIIGVFRN